MTEGWQLHECIRPEEIWRSFCHEHAQVFIADDAFGSTEYRPDAAERWALELDPILRAMDDRHWLIWTSRPAPLNAGLRRINREHGVERFPQPAEVQVAASELDVEEKALILFRHAKSKRLPEASIEVVTKNGWKIVSHRHFTPERIRRFVTDRLPALAETSPKLTESQLSDAVEAEIREPTQAMAASLRALPDEHRLVLIALLDSPPGPVSERQLAAAVRRHAEGGFGRAPMDVVDRLSDHFLRLVTPTSVTWVHPSWRDLIIDEFAVDASARQRFLSHCSLDGVLLALSVGGGTTGERELPVLIEDADWDRLGDRLHALVPELEDGELFRLLAALEVRPEVNERANAELDALAGVVLDRVRQSWDETHKPISSTLLDRWFAATSLLEEELAIPDLTATWVEALPSSPIDIWSATDLLRLEEWLSLVEVLNDHRHGIPNEIGLPGGDASVFSAFIDDVINAYLKLEVNPGSADRLVRCLRRLAVVVPEEGYRALLAAAKLERGHESLEPPPQFSPPALEPPTRDSSVVARILCDLWPRSTG
jgi:hypothetical protein